MLPDKEKLEIQGKKNLFILIWFYKICKNVKYLPWNIVNKLNNSYMTRKQFWKTNSAMLIVHSGNVT